MMKRERKRNKTPKRISTGLRKSEMKLKWRNPHQVSIMGPKMVSKKKKKKLS